MLSHLVSREVPVGPMTRPDVWVVGFDRKVHHLQARQCNRLVVRRRACAAKDALQRSPPPHFIPR